MRKAFIFGALLIAAIAIRADAGDGCGCDDATKGWAESLSDVCDGKGGKGDYGSCLDGLLHPSDHCFDDFISPMSNFVFFEDPRTLTEARAIFLHHELPDSIGTLGIPGGDIQLYAVQLRFALTERLSLIAVKDGYVVSNMDAGPLDNLLNDGWADVTAGLKYNLLRDPEGGRILSAGVTYEIPVGSQRTLQDIADGEFHLFITGGKRFWGGLAHYMGAFGYRLPVDPELQSTSWHWSNHVDVKLTERIYAVAETVWWHWTDSANQGQTLGVSGQDLFNFSSTDVSKNDLFTQAVGLKYKPSGNMELGVSFEFPLSRFNDVLDNRLQAELILRR